MINEFDRKSHNITIENRERISLTGVNDVPSFNDEDIMLCTDFGEIALKGSNLKIESLDLETGMVDINGKIIALIYSEKQSVKSIFKKGIFKQ